VRVSAPANRSTSTTSTPIPTITPPHAPRQAPYRGAPTGGGTPLVPARLRQPTVRLTRCRTGVAAASRGESPGRLSGVPQAGQGSTTGPVRLEVAGEVAVVGAEAEPAVERDRGGVALLHLQEGVGGAGGGPPGELGDHLPRPPAAPGVGCHVDLHQSQPVPATADRTASRRHQLVAVPSVREPDRHPAT